MNFKNLYFVFCTLFVCLIFYENINAEEKKQDVIILYTNDVHCATDRNIGYAGLVAYKNWLLQKTPYVSLVDSGDALHGGLIGTNSKGEYPVLIMNQAGYDFAIFGNHEFDYGIQRLDELLKIAKTQYLTCNIKYLGTGETFLKNVMPYAIKTYGDIKVGFIGVSTPHTITSTNPAYFKDKDGKFLYDFYGKNGEELYKIVQSTVDDCRKAGANYVVILAHLGIEQSSSPFTSKELIENTEGIDVVLDGHSHSIIACNIIKNKSGRYTILSSTGTKFQYIGQLIITTDGNILTSLVDGFPDRDKTMHDLIEDIKVSYDAKINEVIGHLPFPLSINSPDGIRLVRNRETNIGDFIADAVRIASGADVAIVNGGGIRETLPAGEVSIKQVIEVFPFENFLCKVETTGQKILDMLEAGSCFCQADIGKNGVSYGETGSFPQVSGLKFIIDTSVKSSVKIDPTKDYVSIGDTRRVKDVQVLQKDGSYAPLDPAKTYTVAGNDYTIKHGGDGVSVFKKDKFLIVKGKPIKQIIIDYIAGFNNAQNWEKYAKPQGRIIVK